MREPAQLRTIPAVIRAMLWLGKIVYKLYFRLECQGREYALEAIRAGRQMIAIGNHASHLDVLAVISCLGTDALRHFGFPGKKELWENRLLAWFLEGLGGFPLDRSTADVTAARALVRVLRAGRSIGIAPEGTRSLTGEVLPFKSGFVKLALKYTLPILPIAVIGTHEAMPKGARFPRPRQIRVHFGPLMDLTVIEVAGEGEAREDALAEVVRQEVIRLKKRP